MRIPIVIFFVALGPLCSAGPAYAEWVGSWAAAQQLVEAKNQPPIALSHAVLRQAVHLSLGGNRIVVHFSNAFGNGPLTIEAAHVAMRDGLGRINPATDRALTFAGHPSTTIGRGDEVVSDPLAMRVEPFADLAVTIQFGDVPTDLTGHPGSRTTSHLSASGNVAATELPNAQTMAHWYVLSGVDIETNGAASVVVLGDSITDGRGSGTERNDRWPDDLARRLPGVGVLNAGIGGNRLLNDGLGPSGLSRVDRDVAGARGARWLIVLEGVNDIGSGATADRIVAGYADVIARAHKLGLKVYGATILPFGGSQYDTPAHEAVRAGVNDWIRAAGHFDAVIELDGAMRDPNSPTHLRPDGDTGDHLHPNEAGYQRMADAIDPELFRTPPPTR